MKTESPFKDRHGFLSFEEFFLLPYGTPVESVRVHGGTIIPWSRELLREHSDVHDLSTDGVGQRFLADSGIIPYKDGTWNVYTYTRLAPQKPQPPSELDKLRQELKAAREAVERLAVQIEEMSK